MELPAPTAGTITEILAEEGDTVTVGQVIARMQVGAGAAAAARRETSGNGAAAPRPAAPPSPTDAKVSPVAARVAAAEGVDLARRGHRPGGRITKADVLDAKNGDGAPRRRRTARALRSAAAPAMLARYMDESRSIPTATSFRHMTVTAMDTRRKQLKTAGQKVSFTHLIAYAISQAARTTCR
jgi:2-oxoglutarate dehydrogenase E1 component